MPSPAVTAGHGLEEVVRAIGCRAAELTGADGVVIGVVDGPNVHYRFGVGLFEGSEFDGSLLVPAARPLLEGRGLVGDGTEAVSPGVRDRIEHLGVGSVLSLPVRAGQRTCGVIVAVKRGSNAFGEEQLEALAGLGDLVSSAIQSAWALRSVHSWLADNAPIGIAVSAVDGTFLEVNRSFGACLGWKPEELVGRTSQSISHPDDVDLNRRLLERAIEDGSTAFRMEQRYCRPDRSVVWADLSVTIVRDAAGQASQLVSQVVDVTDRVEAELLLAHRASHDWLTGLPNRRRFTDILAAANFAAERRGSSIAVLFLDLDRFQLVNESIGHEGGDVVICEVARRLRLAAESGETVGRFGADAFAIVCEDVHNAAEARRIGARILASLAPSVLVGQREVRTTASIGVALGGANRPTSAPSLLQDAGAACSLAKARGGGTVAMFDEALRDRADERLDVEAALNHAVRRDELRLFFQPEVDLRTGRLVGLEALLRWEHPTLGLLAPEGFLAVAEESGLVVEIGQWVLQAAAEQMGAWRRRWPQMAGVSMGVNLAARQLSDPRLPALVAAARQAAGPGQPLCLEVTESELLASTGDATRVLARLRREGVRVALDDLGTGYASLAYVAGLEADVLKIDRSFTAGLGHHRAESAVVAALISLGRNLGQCMVAEGVETVEQARLLRDLGCDMAQGYLCGKPASALELVPLLEQAAAGSPVFSVQQLQGIDVQRGQPPA